MSAFNSDNYIKDEIEKLRDKFNIKICVETGTHTGNTTIVLGEMFDKVKTIEINANYFKDAVKRLKSKINIECLKGSSPMVLNEVLKYLIQPVLFYLDAHWHDYNPLLDELKVIATYNFNKSVIIIHDFKVPGKDFGYDKFPNGAHYEIKIIRSFLDDIYGKDNYEYYYNDKAAGSIRGVIYIIPKNTQVNNEDKT